MSSQADAAQKLGHELGHELGPAIFEQSEARITFLLQKRQRRMNICKEKWGDEVMVAYNRGITEGLFDFAASYAEKTGMPPELAEKTITDWVGGLKERMERELREVEEAARVASAEAAGLIVKP